MAPIQAINMRVHREKDYHWELRTTTPCHESQPSAKVDGHDDGMDHQFPSGNDISR